MSLFNKDLENKVEYLYELFRQLSHQVGKLSCELISSTEVPIGERSSSLGSRPRVQLKDIVLALLSELKLEASLPPEVKKQVVLKQSNKGE